MRIGAPGRARAGAKKVRPGTPGRTKFDSLQEPGAERHPAGRELEPFPG
jgi:hypothetical protein